ncbi:NADPH quinone reductase MdaB [Helicobacter saguini]|uniref:Flavodoxin family protein n=1 Tax=Helicobacter saguini TaxID=1548018 RepID=A0A347VRY2_9HELI|nr:NAD(P)H-dependent oxidoreductase [Helicobacter saguini]MWV62730.1 NADPH quinone reductase MdaB [Helicobacter saguini]MWV66599.1 NADPH quinone reductase MdaB [Helicobacter saguini]MWV68950.1 NADPH quinone reductase MdaB [Helicobacter saguini]MWV71496.1 NADPH quinone reductase MdaB [Helicobacter saguini]TLD92200.1 flavodoxin family protein [Helicobacter saguini]
MTALLLNGGKKFAESTGRLSDTLQNVAKEYLESKGFQVLETHIDKGYNEQDEVQKWLDSNLIVWQMPAWWMGEPYIVKEYIDKVFMAGFGKIFKSDGRHADNPNVNYGKGGLLQGKKALFSVTWNAPLNAFVDKNEFFEGVGVEGVYLHFRKIHEFIGMSVLPIFMCNDVMKNPQIEQYIANYKAHLEKYIN